MEITENFYASGDNEVHLVGSGTHKINMWNKWWPTEDQYFNKLILKDRGIESLDVKEVFDCKNGFVVNDWSFLTEAAYNGNLFILEPIGMSKTTFTLGLKKRPDRQDEILGNVHSGVMRLIAEKGKKKKVDGLSMAFVCQAEKDYYYINSNGDVCKYSISVNYTGTNTNNGYGTVTYEESGEEYVFMFAGPPENIAIGIEEFKKEVLKYAKGKLENITSEYSAVYKDSLRAMVAECFGTTSNVIQQLEKGVKEFSEELKKQNDELQQYYKTMKALP